VSAHSIYTCGEKRARSVCDKMIKSDTSVVNRKNQFSCVHSLSNEIVTLIFLLKIPLDKGLHYLFLEVILFVFPLSEPGVFVQCVCVYTSA